MPASARCGGWHCTTSSCSTSSTGPRSEALRYAQGALENYPAHAPGRVAVTFDVAAYWMLGGYFEEALATYRAVLPRLQARSIPNALGAIARAAGALGREAEYEEAVCRLESCTSPGEGASAWVFAGYGAVNLERWDEGRAHVQRGLEAASARQEHQVVFEAEGLLRQIDERSRPTLPVVQRESAVQALNCEVVATIESIYAPSAA